MLMEAERMAQTAICPCCHKEGDFSVLMNCSFREKECHVECHCNQCHTVFSVEPAATYELVAVFAEPGAKLRA